MKYNLNDNVSEEFEFSLGGVTYFMKYPTGEELEAIAQGSAEFSKQSEIIKAARDSGDEKAVSDAQKKLQEAVESSTSVFSSLTRAEKEDDLPIEEALKKATVPVIRNYQQMLQAELSMEVAPARA